MSNYSVYCGRAVRAALITAAAAGAGVFVNPAIAQNVSADTLEEILVVARKREEKLQDVPISMSVLTTESLDRLGVSRVSDIAFQIPNFVFFGAENTPSQASPVIRGVRSRVGVYIDEIYLGSQYSFNASLPDVERIEVLRGPQGTVFGKNSVAGVLSLVTRRPPQEFEGRANLKAGNYNLYEANGWIGGPIVEDKVAASLAVIRRERDGSIDNTAGGSFNDEDSTGGRGQVLFTPSESLDIRVSADFQRDRNNDGAWEPFGTPAGVLIGAATYDRRVSSGPSFSTRDMEGASVRADKRFSSHTLTLLGAYRHTERFINWDQDYSLARVTNSELGNEVDETSFEARIASNLGGKLNYTAGVYYYDSGEDVLSRRIQGPDDALVIANGLTSFTTTNPSSTDIESYAVFGQVSYDFTEQLTASVGGRWTSEDRHFQSLTFTSVPALNPGSPLTTRDLSESEFSPSASVSYKFGDNVTTYVQYAKGFTSGSFNTSATTPEGQRVLDPEYITNYEVGVKFAAFDQRVRASLAAFWMDYKDMQRFQVVNGTFLATNAAKAHSDGYEFEGAARVTSNFEIGLGVGYNEAQFDDYRDANGPGTDLSGNFLPFAPEWTGNVSVNYGLPLGSVGRLELFAQAVYRDTMHFNESNTPLFLIPDQTQYNARLTWRNANDRWSVSAYGTNLTDEVYVTNVGFAAGLYTVNLSDPRFYGMELSFRF